MIHYVNEAIKIKTKYIFSYVLLWDSEGGWVLMLFQAVNVTRLKIARARSC